MTPTSEPSTEQLLNGLESALTDISNTVDREPDEDWSMYLSRGWRLSRGKARDALRQVAEVRRRVASMEADHA